jgi:NADH-quinone oxidoreductase subunit G
VCALPGEGGRSTREIIAAAGAGDLDLLFLLGADEFDMNALGRAFVIYQGTHGDRGAHRADVILPGAAYTEKSVTYVNTEGRPQTTLRAAFPPGDAREDWAILRALSAVAGHPLPWDSLTELRSALYRIAPHLQRLDTIEPSDPLDIKTLAEAAGRMSRESFQSVVIDFYMTNPIARASRIMGECSALRVEARLEAAE